MVVERADLMTVRRGLALICAPGSVYELRALSVNGKKRTDSGYFDNLDAMAQAAVKVSGHAKGVYLTLNPVDPELLGRAYDRMVEFADKATADDKIVERRWFPIDVDKDRDSHVSATDDEVAAATQRAEEIAVWLAARGWPDPFKLASGNGCHLLYPVRLPNDDATRDLFSRALHGLGLQFDDRTCRVDKTVFNAARIWKCPGTLAMKGDETPDRKHRIAYILDEPSGELLSREQIEAVAALVPADEPAAPSTGRNGNRPGRPFDVDEFIRQYHIDVRRESSWKETGRKWLLACCPFNADHTDSSAVILQFPSGAVDFRCHHDSCTGNRWRELKTRVGFDRDREAESLLGAIRCSPPLLGAKESAGIRAQTNGFLGAESLLGEKGEKGAEETNKSGNPPDWEPVVHFGMGDLPPFPISALTGWLRTWAEAEAQRTQTPVDLPAMLALAALATAWQKKVRAKPKADWEQPVNLQLVVILGSGNRKTDVFTDVMRPILEWEQEEAQSRRALIVADQLDRAVKQDRIEHLKKSAAREEDRGARATMLEEAKELSEYLKSHPALVEPDLLLDDITSEELVTMLVEQGGRAAICSDEGDIFEIMAGRYSNGRPNIQIYLKGHTGKSNVKLRRRNRREYVPYPAITLGISAQQSVLKDLIENKVFEGKGLLGRLLYSVPQSPLGDRLTGAAIPPMPPAIELAFAARIKRMLGWEPPIGSNDHFLPWTLHFEEEAKQVIYGLEGWIESRIHPVRGELGWMPSWASKWAGHVVRIAALLHLAKYADEERPWDWPVEAQTVEEATLIGQYLVEHAKFALGEIGVDSRYEAAKTLWDRILAAKCVQEAIQAGERETEFTHQQLWQEVKDRGLFRHAEAVNDALRILLDRNYLREVPVARVRPSGRPPKPHYQLHPDFFVPTAPFSPFSPNRDLAGVEQLF